MSLFGVWYLAYYQTTNDYQADIIRNVSNSFWPFTCLTISIFDYSLFAHIIIVWVTVVEWKRVSINYYNNLCNLHNITRIIALVGLVGLENEIKHKKAQIAI